MEEVLFEIGAVIVVSTVLALVGRFFKQPNIVAYIVAGILIGPVGLALIENQEVIGVFSELGIIFLLFIVGLELDLRKLKDLGKTSLLVGVGQMVFTSLLGFGVAFWFFSALEAAYLAVALAFSSTVIVLKLLSDKKELDTLHGRVALGVLLVQDLFAILALVVFSSIGSLSLDVLLIAALKIVFLFALTYGAYLLIIPRLFRHLAQDSEELFLGAVSMCFILAMVASALGLSAASGAFLAGIALAATPYSLEMVGRVKSLRDFFVVMFFVTLGLQITFAPLRQYLWPIVALCAFVVVGNPLIMMVIMRALRYTRHTSFLTAISLAQISEFSLKLVAAGYAFGHLSLEILSITAVVAIVTISASAYFITHGDSLYHLTNRFLFKEKIRDVEPRLRYTPKRKYQVVLVGHNRLGFSVLNKLRQLRKSVLVVDYNPETIRRLIQQKVPCLYGDVGDLEIIEHLNLSQVGLLISTAPSFSDNLLLLDQYKRRNRRGKAIFSAQQPHEALELYRAGADYVIVPHLVGGDHLGVLLEEHHADLDALLVKKKLHMHELRQRRRHAY